MGPRPARLELRDDRSEDPLPTPSRPNFYVDIPSPRAGEVPPALSPLDAFHLHARMLAQQFQQEAQKGRRISRLPPTAVARELANRPDYFRSISGRSEGEMSELPEVQEEERPTSKSGLTVAGASEKDRPISHYPMLGSVRKSEDERHESQNTGYYDANERQRSTSGAQDYFGVSAPRASSPEPVDPRAVTVEAPLPIVPRLTNSMDSVQSSQPRTLTNDSTRSQRSERGLAPPKSPAFPRSPRSFQSIRSVRQDSGDDDTFPTHDLAAAPSSRKFSGSSGVSRPQSPFSPCMHPVQRSPSMTSEYSMNGSQHLPKPSYNFSRPMSSSGNRPSLGTRPSMDMTSSMDARPSFESRTSFDARPSTKLPLRNASAGSTGTHPSTTFGPSRQTSQDDAPTPFPGTSVESEAVGHDDPSGEPNPAPSYVYTKFSLPRGRNVERNSIEPRDSWIHHQFTWEEKRAEAPEQSDRNDRDSSTVACAVRAPSPRLPDNVVSDENRQLRQRAFSSANRSQSADPRGATSAERLYEPSPSIRTDSTDRTIRACPPHQRSASAGLTPEEHLEIGIQAHSANELNKSTYYLRLAAKAGLPTAMLLYALACRHGWGMRPNQEDGVAWLRKAINGSQLEMADVEAQLSNASRRQANADPVAEAQESKKRKAQFALSIYELGISYMNGWGCPKDKSLALNCYEIAGGWGDCDALAEAGFCYTQGLGCKKDLKKAANLYRKAAEGGMSMAGNSWIYKPKYMDEPGTPEKRKRRTDTTSPRESKEKDARPPTRSRARSMWSRRKEKE